MSNEGASLDARPSRYQLRHHRVTGARKRVASVARVAPLPRSRRWDSSVSRSRCSSPVARCSRPRVVHPRRSYDPAANTVRAVGGAPSFGPATGMRLNASLVDIAATPSGRGYWTAASDGGVFSFGDAAFLGSVAGFPLVAPVVGIAATPSGNGYWLVASDGGVFAFGDAEFHGSVAGTDAATTRHRRALPRRRRATATGSSAPTAASSPSVTPHSRARRRPSAHGAPIVGMAPTASGYGYFLLGADGGVFAFGDAHFAGSTIDGSHFATAIAIPSNGKGYQVARSDGSVVGRGGAASIAGAGRRPSRQPAPGRRDRGPARTVARGWPRRFNPPAAVASQSLVARIRSSSARVRTSRTRPADTARSARTVCTAAPTNSCARRGTTRRARPAVPTSSVSTRRLRRPPTRISWRCSSSNARAPARGAVAAAA